MVWTQKVYQKSSFSVTYPCIKRQKIRLIEAKKAFCTL